MSAFAAIYQPSGFETRECLDALARVMQRLSHRGSGRSHTVFVDKISMGYWHFGTTPEELGECQPLKLNNMPFRIVFDGRIDNRDELFALLDISPADGKTLSDAVLTLHAYVQWGDDCFKRFIGEFALVIFDEQLNEVTAVRDHLGDRTLFYTFFGAQLVIASEPWAVTGAGLEKPVVDEIAAAHYFALQVPPDGRTFFKGVRELLPAHVLKVNAADHRLWRYWSPDPYKSIRYKNDEEYAGHFRSLLDESVRSRMRSSFPVSVLMSGGLDSSSIACLTAQQIAPQKLTTISYIFDELVECDERQFIESVKEKHGIHSIQIPCDDAWTFKNWESWPHNPNQPEGNLYRMILERVYQRVQAENIHVLLTGYMADQLYSAGQDWIADLIIDRQFLRAGQQLASQIKNRGWKTTLAMGHFRRTARRALDSIFPGAIRLPRRKSLPAWINPAFRSSFTGTPVVNSSFERHGTLLSLETSNDLAHAFRNTARYQIDLRNPYRDRRLIEFILAIPAYQLYYRGVFKPVLRAAMRGVLPEMIRTRYTKTSFVSLYRRGIKRERGLLESCLEDPKAQWRKFLKPDWASKMLSFTEASGVEALLPFLCLSYETWHRSFISEN